MESNQPEGRPIESPEVDSPATAKTESASTEIGPWAAEVDRLAKSGQPQQAARKAREAIETAQARGDRVDASRAARRAAELIQRWFEGPSRLEVLESVEVPDDPAEALALWLARAVAIEAEGPEEDLEIDRGGWTESAVSPRSRARHRSRERTAWLAAYKASGHPALEAMKAERFGALTGTPDLFWLAGLPPRDLVAHRWATALGQTSTWSAADTLAFEAMTTESLLDGQPSLDLEAVEAVIEVHPARLATRLLADLERRADASATETEGESGRRLAAFARLARLQVVMAMNDRASMRDAVVARYTEWLDRLERQDDRSAPWGLYLVEAVLGQQQRGNGTAAPADGQQARTLREALARWQDAAAGDRAYDQVLERLRNRLISLEAPRFHASARSSFAPGQALLEIHYRNVESFDLTVYPLGRREPNSLDRRQLTEWFLSDDAPEPVVHREVSLEATPDLAFRTLRLPLPLDSVGRWAVLLELPFASRFGPGAPQRETLVVQTSPWAVAVEPALAGLWVQVQGGVDGSPVEGATVEVSVGNRRGAGPVRRRLASRQGESTAESPRVFRATTDAEGRAWVALADSKDGSAAQGVAVGGPLQGFVVVEKAEVFHALEFSFWNPPRELAPIGEIVTDRSAYRPGHTVHFTMALRSPGVAGQQTPLTERESRVRLVDPAQTERASLLLTTDAFGLADGRFELPSSAPLGAWRLESDLGWSVSRQIVVEEYRRPTAELQLDPPTTARLGEPIGIVGRALDRSGRPLRGLEVTWTAIETSIGGLPKAFSRPSSRWVDRQVVDRGTGLTDAEGRFELLFERPKTLAWWEAVESEAYNGGFEIEAEATTEGGETIKAQVQFPVARPDRAVEIEVQVLAGASAAPRAVVGLTQVDPQGRPAREPAEYRLEPLVPPAAAAWPPCAGAPTPRPGLRAAGPQAPCPARPGGPEGLDAWAIGGAVESGSLTFDEAGRAELTLSMAPGAYRLLIRGEDSAGVPFEASDRFLAPGLEAPLIPLVLQLEPSTVAAVSTGEGASAHAVVSTAFAGQRIDWRLYRAGRLLEQRLLAGPWPRRVDLPRLEGPAPLEVVARLVRDHHEVIETATLAIDPDPRGLEVEIGAFRDELRPGEPASLRVAVSRGAQPLPAGAAAVTATVFDRALEAIAAYAAPNPLASNGSAPRPPRVSSLGTAVARGVVTRRLSSRMDKSVASDSPEIAMMAEEAVVTASSLTDVEDSGGEVDAPAADPVRRDFSETALWAPARALGADGSVIFDFQMPDAATEWAAWAFAFGRDGSFGSATKRARSARDLLVRPRVPRFVREGDAVELAVTVSWEGDGPFAGTLAFDLLDPASTAAGGAAEEISRLADFGAPQPKHELRLEPGETATVLFPLQVPMADSDAPSLGAVAVRAVARGQALLSGGAEPRADGELRVVPVLPARVRLLQSRARLLSAGETATLRFDELAQDDPARETEAFGVRVEGRLIESAFAALPYLVDFPYRCAEQTAARLLAGALASQLLEREPTLARTAASVDRETRFEPFELPATAPLTEESPWAAGDPAWRVERLHDPAIASAVRNEALDELVRLFDGQGGVPWFAGGPPSPPVTAQVLATLVRVRAFEGDVERSDLDGLISNGLEFLRQQWVLPAERAEAEAKATASSEEPAARRIRPIAGWTNWARLVEILSSTRVNERRRWTESMPRILERALAEDSPERPALGRLRLAIALQRLDRPEDARRIWRSVADSLAIDPESGARFLRPGDRSTWDDGHVMRLATALQAVLLIEPDSPLREPLVRGLLASRTLARWESTLATGEAVWALAAAAIEDGSLDAVQHASVRVGPPHDAGGVPAASERSLDLVLEPGTSTRGRLLALDPATVGPWAAETVVENQGPGLLDAVATWRFATATPPADGDGDRLQIERRLFRRVGQGEEASWEPLAAGDAVAVGDLVEVRLRVKATMNASFVHLRDPRPAGFEPEAVRSGWRWDGVAHYREIRDSGINLFFERLGAGSHAFRHRIRASTAGVFRAGPAQIGSFYAPEHGGYSAGLELRVEP